MIHTDTVRAVELGPEEAAPILQHYLEKYQEVPFIAPYFQATAKSPLADFEREAAQHPVFRPLRRLDRAVDERPTTGSTERRYSAGRRAATSFRSMGRGYLGPAPIKGHGPHRYVFQLFALAKPVTPPSRTALESAKPRQVLASAADVLARGRLDGIYERR